MFLQTGWEIRTFGKTRRRAAQIELSSEADTHRHELR
jgi:hypothetical protein